MTPLRYSPRPVRALRRKARDLADTVAFYGILATRGVLGASFFLALGLVPA